MAHSSTGLNGFSSRLSQMEAVELDHSKPLNGHVNGYTTPRKLHDGVPILSPDAKNSVPFRDTLNDSVIDPPHETVERTSHSASLCFGAAVLFMGLAFFEGYRLIGERSVSLLIRGTVWAVVATIIGTAGEILQKTTIETPILPANESTSKAGFKEGQFPGLPNGGTNVCFINAPTQAIMNDREYPRVFKSICENAKKRHVNFKKFLELFPSPNRYLPSLPRVTLPKFIRSTEVVAPLAVDNMHDVLVMLMMRKSSINYGSDEFLRKYPTIHRLIGEFLTVAKDADFPTVFSDEDKSNLRNEFGLMVNDQGIVEFFSNERAKIASELLGFEAYLYLIHAYENAVADKTAVVSFGRWLPSQLSSPISNIRKLIRETEESSQEDVEEFLHCLSKYILPGDYPKIFLSVAYERTWAKCPEQDADKLIDLKFKNDHPRNPDDILTRIDDDLKIVEKPSPLNVLKLSGFLREGLNGQELIDETFGLRKGPDDPNKTTHYYLDSAGEVHNYYLVKERILQPAVMPERMILQVERCTMRGTEIEKITCAVNMPEQITIFDCGYRLKTVIEHGGGSNKGGHYHALINKPLDNYQSQWWFASDETVEEALSEHVERAKSYGYLYFYEKIPSLDDLGPDSALE